MIEVLFGEESLSCLPQYVIVCLIHIQCLYIKLIPFHKFLIFLLVLSCNVSELFRNFPFLCMHVQEQFVHEIHRIVYLANDDLQLKVCVLCI